MSVSPRPVASIMLLPDGDKRSMGKTICQLKNGDVLRWHTHSKNVYLLMGKVRQVFDYAHHQISSIYSACVMTAENL